MSTVAFIFCLDAFYVFSKALFLNNAIEINKLVPPYYRKKKEVSIVVLKVGKSSSYFMLDILISDFWTMVKPMLLAFT